MRVLLALVAVLAACSAQSKEGPVIPSTDGSVDPSRCTPGAQVACACLGGTTGVQVCGASSTFGACFCGGDAGTPTDAPTDASVGPAAYDRCTSGQTCGGGTLCAPVGFTADGSAANLCTSDCATNTTCPSAGNLSTFAPTCVVSATSGRGQCYATCASSADCGVGTRCSAIPGTTAQVCVPGGDAQPVVSAAYSGACAPVGGACAGGTTCANASFTTGGAGTFCTVSCTVGGTACPDSLTSASYTPTCVVNGATGLGQCYDTCGSNADCTTGTQCAVIPGTAARICVPAGTGGTTQPPLAAAYTACTPAGGACGSSTTCTPAAYVRGGAPQGNFCTTSCVLGQAAMCPGYVPGAARQSVECVAPLGNVAAAQCMQLCNSEADCASYFTHCTAVQMAAGTLNVCLP